MSGDDRGALLRRGRTHRTVRQEEAHLATAATDALTVEALPTPYDVEETVTRPLNEHEREHLAVCEQALHGFRRSVIVAGKALEVISRGRLYRETHRTFVEYLDDVWEIRKSQAYRMIEAWPVAATVPPIGDINEGQARELRPVFQEYGQEAAVSLYRQVKELRGDRRVTAADLAEARKVLPPPRQLAGPHQLATPPLRSGATGRRPSGWSPWRRSPPPTRRWRPSRSAAWTCRAWRRCTG
ncbi:hypothetical protein ACPCSD_33890 [Streptomyces griseoincarnatus]